MRTTLSIDDELLDAAKEQARAERVTLGAYVEEALRQRLTAPAPEPAAPVRFKTVPGNLRPGIDPLSNRALFEAIEDEELRW